MNIITSVRNPHIQHIRALQRSSRTRRQEGLFVAEGVRLLEEALHADWRPHTLLAAAELPPRAAALVDAWRAQGVEPLWVAGHVLTAAGDTQTPQGVLAIFPRQPRSIGAQPNFLLLLDGIHDPGNLGTILRTAWAAGVDGVLLSPENADPFAPKVVRAGMGAHFHLPVVQADWDTLIASLGSLPVYMAEARRGARLFDVDFRSPCVLLIGGEAAGAGETARTLAVNAVHIPMPGAAESLNAAVAAAILMFEVVRQRSPAPLPAPEKP
ncbi:MAG: RNA methyltransferase [Anaerolineales bacterium]